MTKYGELEKNLGWKKEDRGLGGHKDMVKNITGYDGYWHTISDVILLDYYDDYAMRFPLLVHVIFVYLFPISPAFTVQFCPRVRNLLG